MAKQHNEEAPEAQQADPASPQITMSANDLKALITQVVAAQSESNKALAEAIRDSKIPYIDPKKEENEEMFRENTRKQEERKRKQTLASQDWCEHIAGGMGDVRDPGNRTSIVWHRFDDSTTVGICTQCIRVIRETDADFRKWYNKPKFNKMSRSGDRYIDRTAAAV